MEIPPLDLPPPQFTSEESNVDPSAGIRAPPVDFDELEVDSFADNRVPDVDFEEIPRERRQNVVRDILFGRNADENQQAFLPFNGSDVLLDDFRRSHFISDFLQQEGVGIQTRTQRSAFTGSFYLPFGFTRPIRGNRPFYGNYLRWTDYAFDSVGNQRIALFWKLLPHSLLFNAHPRAFFGIGLKTVNMSINSVVALAMRDYETITNLDIHPAVFRGRTFLTLTRQRDSGMSVERFIQLLFADFLAIYDEGVNSGNANENENFVAINIFLKVTQVQAPVGGCVPSSENFGSSLHFLKNNKGVFIPNYSSDSSCFWMCYAKQLIQSNDTFRKYPLKVLSQKLFETFSSYYTSHDGNGLVLTSKEVPIPFLSYIEDAFGIEVLVLDIHGDVLYGTMNDVYTKTFENFKHMKLCLVDEHYVLIENFLSFIPYNKCYRCDQRFQTKQKLKYHLEKNVCLTCDCKKVTVNGKRRRYTSKNTTVEKFKTEEQWRHHRNNLLTECPLQSEEAKQKRKSDPVEVEQRLLRRFQTPKERHYTRPEDRTVIYFDLECIVPYNTEYVNGEYLPQIPYAAGWLTVQNNVVGSNVEIAYGLNCVDRFIQYLNTLYQDTFQTVRQKVHEMLVWNGDVSKMRRTWKFAMKYRIQKNLMCFTCQQPNIQDVNVHENCILKYAVESRTRKEMANSNSDICPRIVIYAHNGGRYDWLFLHRYFMENGLLENVQVLRANNRYINLVYKRLFVFRDTVNFLSASLERLGKDYGVQTLKGVFPYDLMQEKDMIYASFHGEEEIRTIIPREFLKVTDSFGGDGGMSYKRAMTEEEYVDFFENERGWSYNVEKETVKYLRDDVLCLAQVVTEFSKGFRDLTFAMDFFDYDTIGQMSHYYFQRFYLDPLVYTSLSLPETKWIRRAVYGGRTEVFVRYLYDGAVEDSANKNIYYYDVNSLYPYIMEQRDLPGGDPIWYFPTSSDAFREFSTELEYQPIVQPLTVEITNWIVYGLRHNVKDVYGFVDVEVTPPQDLMYPVLPERRSVGSNTKNFFCLRNKRGVYYTEELKLAVSKGYVINQVFSFSQWQRTCCYKNFVKDLKRLKLKAEGRNSNGEFDSSLTKNKSLRQASKLMQNSSFGKTIQRYNDRVVSIVDNPMELWKISKKAKEIGIIPLFTTEKKGDIVEVTVKLPDGVNDKSCPAIGAAILAEARMELYSYFQWCEDNDASVLYCDTDSIVYCGHQPLPNHMLDDVMYGKMKLEIPTDNIMPNGFVALSPKCYAFKMKDGTPYVKCKGVNTSNNIISSMEYQQQLEEIKLQQDVNNLLMQDASPETVSFNGISFDTLLSIVKGDVKSSFSSQMVFLKNKSREIIRVQSKKLLCDTFDKRKVCLNGSTFPWSNCNVSNYLIDGDPFMSSNFLRYASIEEIVSWIEQCGGIRGDLFSKMLPIFLQWQKLPENEEKVKKMKKFILTHTPSKFYSNFQLCGVV